MKKGFSKQFPGKFDEMNFDNPCFARELNFVSCKINGIFPPQKFFLLFLFSKVVVEK